MSFNRKHHHSQPVVRPVPQWERIDPETARRWLQNNKVNRRVSNRHLQTLINAIRSGHWRSDNAQPIQLGVEDDLLDGQHRLLAVIEANTPIWCLVVRGVATETQEVMDTGRRRSVADALHMSGEINASSLAASLVVLRSLLSGNNLTDKSAMTVAEARELLTAHPRLRDSVKAVQSGKRIRYPMSVSSALHYLFSREDSEAAQAFFTGLFDGDPMFHKMHPILKLRAQMMADATARKRLKPRHRAALTIKAWQLWNAGKEIQYLTWRTGGQSPEQFPDWRLPIGITMRQEDD